MPKRKADPGPSRDFCKVNAVAIPKLRFVDEAPDKATGFYDPKTKKHRECAVTDKSVMGRDAARRETELQRDFNESLESERARMAKREDKATALLAKREKSSTIGGTRFDRDLESEGFILFRIYITFMITLVQAQYRRPEVGVEVREQFTGDMNELGDKIESMIFRGKNMVNIVKEERFLFTFIKFVERKA